MRKVAIVGSRRYANLDAVWDYVKALPDDTIIVTGGAKGVDSAAEMAAEHYGKKVIVLKPDWRKHGRKAGILRNAEIVAEADEVVAFWDGSSRGTQDTIARAKAAGKLKDVFEEDYEEHLT